MPERRAFEELEEDLQSEKKRSGDKTDMRPCQARKEANSTNRAIVLNSTE